MPGNKQRTGPMARRSKSSVAAFRWPLGAIALIALAAANSATMSARPADEFPAFIPMPGLSAEGVAVDRQGNVFVTVRDAGQGKVWKYTPSGEPSLVATINGAMIGGLAISADGGLYAAMAEGSDRGVYRIGRGGSASRLRGTEEIVFANALAFDHRGTLYVTESYSRDGAAYGRGGIWRIRPGKTAELWLRHDLLTGIGAVLGYPVGANGIAFFQGNLYVVNTDKSMIVRVPILPNGRPGEPAVWASLQEVPGSPLAGSPFPVMGDGLELDGQGNAYVALVSRNAVVRINSATLAQETVASLSGYPAAPLDTPASLALGPRDRCPRDLFVTNLGWMATIIPGPTWPGAGLVKINADARVVRGSLTGEVWWRPWERGSCACASGVEAVTAATGELSQLGATGALFSHCAPAPPDESILCTQLILVGADGDELWATYDTEHYTGEPFAGSFVLTFTGGTGRFRHATGSGVLSWQVVPVFDADGNMDLSVHWAWSGEIDGTVSTCAPRKECRHDRHPEHR